MTKHNSAVTKALFIMFPHTSLTYSKLLYWAIRDVNSHWIVVQVNRASDLMILWGLDAARALASHLQISAFMLSLHYFLYSTLTHKILSVGPPKLHSSPRYFLFFNLSKSTWQGCLYLDWNTREAELSECKLSARLWSVVLGTAGGPLSQTGHLTKLSGSLCSEG